MDAGLSALRNPNTSANASSKAQLRNQLLQNDIPSFDVGNQGIIQEEFQGRNSQQSYPMQQNYSGARNYPQQQNFGNMNRQERSPQYPVNRQPQFNGMGHPIGIQAGAPIGHPPSGYMGQSINQHPPFQRTNAPSKRYTQTTYDQPERRAYSLNQKSISSFFKNSRFSHSKSKALTTKEEDDEEIMLEDDDQPTLTFHDIKVSGNKGGDRYGYGGDTAPVIPMIVTRDHNNMNSTEYRKHMFAQRKMAMNAVNKQQKGAPFEPRAMSLQTYGNKSPFTQGRISEHSYSQNNPGFATSRASSLMHGPPSFQNQPHPMQGNNFSTSMDPYNSNQTQTPGPRSMSLSTSQTLYSSGNSNKMVPRQKQGGNRHMGPFPNNNYTPQKVSSSNESLSKSSEGTLVMPPLPSSAQPQPNSSEGNHESQMRPRLKNTNSDQTPMQRKGQLNVLKLSDPQKDELDRNKKLLSLKDKELGEERILLKQQKDNLELQMLDKYADEVHEQQKILQQKPEKAAHDHNEAKSSNSVILDPLPELEAGLESLSMNNGRAPRSNNQGKRISNETFVSTFSESPQKTNKLKKNTGMYKLEGSANNSVFVTAQEFPNEPENISNASHMSIRKESIEGESPNTSTDTIDGGNSTLKASITGGDVSNASADQLNSDALFSTEKRSSFIKAKNFLRKLSSNSLTKDSDEDPQLALKKSPTNVSIDSVPSSNNDTFHYRTQNKNPNNRLSVLSTSSRNIPDNNKRISTSSKVFGDTMLNMDSIKVTKDLSDDEFDFDNTAGQPYEPLFTDKDCNKASANRKTIFIAGDQLNIINENKQLMQEITLVSTELVESIKRETILESQLKHMAGNNKFSTEREHLSLDEFETELRKKSSKIVELIQQLNEERLKRFIAEEQLLLQENGMKPSSIDLVHTITTLNSRLREKDVEIEMLRNALDNSQS